MVEHLKIFHTVSCVNVPVDKLVLKQARDVLYSAIGYFNVGIILRREYAGGQDLI